MLQFQRADPGVIDCISTILKPEEMPGLEILEVRDKDALATTRALMRHGFPVGASSGLNYAAAVQIARRLGPAAQVVTVLPDRMERYFTTEVFEPMRAAV